MNKKGQKICLTILETFDKLGLVEKRSPLITHIGVK